MKHFIHAALAAIAIATASIAFTSCSDSDSEQITINGTGISNQSWSNTYEADNDGETFKLTFTASDAWTAASNASWCTLSPVRGRDGRSEITVTVAPNNTGKKRTANIIIRVAGADRNCTLEVVQTPEAQGTYSDVNRWMLNYMNTNYLWNEPLASFDPDYSLSYDRFLISALDFVDADDHRNRDDGHWVNGKRAYYYSFIDSDAPTRSAGEEETSSGITYLSAGTYTDTNNDVLLLPAMVAPGSPAYEAGIRRGDLIGKVGGTRVTRSNYSALAEKLFAGNVTATKVELTYENSQPTGYTEIETVNVGRATFTDPAIYCTKVVELEGGKKVGYIAYTGFDTQFDSQLINIFGQFKSNGVTDLVLDLRYNGGGHVLSSVVLGTLIAGNNKTGQLYNRTTYNASRTAKGEIGDYYIGKAETPERNYSKISEALSSSLGLNTIYVLTTENTASASELIINGLRGLDITVNIVGTTTNGKNVGMEAISQTFGSYEFLFAPITFYSQNAKGFRDYSDGFTPDVSIDESAYFYGDFGTTDDVLCRAAFQWISSGTKPSVSQSRAASGQVRDLMHKDLRTPTLRNHGTVAFPED